MHISIYSKEQIFVKENEKSFEILNDILLFNMQSSKLN
jgi:hypothetical protein